MDLESAEALGMIFNYMGTEKRLVSEKAVSCDSRLEMWRINLT